MKDPKNDEYNRQHINGYPGNDMIMFHDYKILQKVETLTWVKYDFYQPACRNSSISGV